MATIIVTGKADLGHSPKFGEIRKGQKYTIEEIDFAVELFTAPKGFDTTPYEPQSAVAPDVAKLPVDAVVVNTVEVVQ
jgi:hypothetical protein